MAYDKVVDSAKLNSNLKQIGNAIRSKTGDSMSYSFPDGMVSAINKISGGGNNNCEAYVITLPDYKLNFKNTGKIKLWGYGEDGSGYQKTGYAFAGTVYHRTGLSGGQSTVNVTLNSQGKLDGLPSMTSATLLVTLGV